MASPVYITFNQIGQAVAGFHRVSTADTNAAVIKAGPGIVTGLVVTNSNAAPRYLKLYNKATAPTVGTDIPAFTFLIPTNLGVNIDMASGLYFSTGISMAITTGAADTDTGAAAVAEQIVSLQYL